MERQPAAYKGRGWASVTTQIRIQRRRAKMASGLQFVLFVGFICGLATVDSKAIGSTEDAAHCPAPCPPGWTQLGSRCFIYFRQSRTWSDAEKTCISLGGNLASIHSTEENEFISDHIKQVSGGYSRTWIGGYDAVKETTWLWSDGSSFDYVRWNSGQPYNYYGYEDCVEINYYGDHWDTRRCTYYNPFICSKDL